MHEGIIEVIRDKRSEKCDLTEAALRDNDISELCRHLRENPHKQVVILDRTVIRDATDELAKLNLKKLSLRFTNVNDESVKALCNSSIDSLDLGRANLTDKGGRFIAEHCRQIQVRVDTTQITRQVAELIKEKTADNLRLRQEFQAKQSLFTSPEKSDLNLAKGPEVTNGEVHPYTNGRKL